MNLFFQALDRAHFLPEIGSGKEVLTQYQQLCMALDEYIRKTFHEWTLTIDKVSYYYCQVYFICRFTFVRSEVGSSLDEFSQIKK